MRSRRVRPRGARPLTPGSHRVYRRSALGLVRSFLSQSWKPPCLFRGKREGRDAIMSASRVETLAQSAEAGLSPSDRRVARALLRAHSTPGYDRPGKEEGSKRPWDMSTAS